MAGSARKSWVGVVVTVTLCLTAAVAPAETPSDEEVVQETPSPAPLLVFDREVNAMLLPQFREPEAAAAARRRPKAHTILQLDAPVGEEGDVMFRVQAKRKEFLFLEFRF